MFAFFGFFALKFGEATSGELIYTSIYSDPGKLLGKNANAMIGLTTCRFRHKIGCIGQ